MCDINLLEHRAGRAIIAFAFYFAEGAPIGFIWWAMPTLLRKNGVNISTITSFTAMLTLPWVFKFLWAPLVDLFRTSKFGYKKWIAYSQLLMCLTLLPLVFIPLEGNVMWWGILLLLHSLCAATQDVSVDSLVINVIAKHEKGILNGYMQAGMLLGRSIFGGAALIFIPTIGLPVTIALMIGFILCISVLLFFIKEPIYESEEKNNFHTFKNNLKQTFFKKHTWYVIAFALTAAAAFESAGGLSGAFFTDKHASLKSIGFFFSVPVVISMLLGALVGGFLSDKMSRKRAVTIFLIGLVFIISIISAVDAIYPLASSFSLFTLYSLMYFFIGMFTSSSYALFMDVTNPKLGATEFSTFMAATNGCESWVVYTSGLIVSASNYHVAFLTMCIVSLLSLIVLRKIRA